LSRISLFFRKILKFLKIFLTAYHFVYLLWGMRKGAIMKRLIIIGMILSCIDLIAFSLYIMSLYADQKIHWMVSFFTTAITYVYIIFCVYQYEKHFGELKYDK
jgi:hypothetical protein